MTDSSRPISPEALDDDRFVDAALRPENFADYVGQQKMKERLRIAVTAARKSGRTLDHVLLSGPPGLGKTTMAKIIANELGVALHNTSGPAIEKKGDLAGILTAIEEGDVLFIDEIHRLSAVVEENLYPAMEDFHIDVMIGDGAHARSLKIDLPPFTLIGATTRTGLLTSPLRGRFGIMENLEPYLPEDLARIILRSARLLDMVLDDDAADEMARRSRGTPRIANRLLRRVRDFAEVQGVEIIDRSLADQALTIHEIDARGFDRLDRRYLEVVVVKFGGGPVGLDTIGAALGESSHTLEEVVEPFLIQEGFIQRTPRGRLATPHAARHLGVKLPNTLQAGLFDGLDGEDS